MSNIGDTAPFSGAGKDAIKVSPLRFFSATAVALVLNLLAMWVGSAAGASLETSAPEPINAIVVAIVTVVPLLLAGVVVWFLAQRFPIQRLAAWAGLVFALVSSAGSFLASADTMTAFTLAAMHFITGFAWFIAVRTWVKIPRP